MTHPLSNDAHQNMINISDEGVMSKRQNKKGSASSQGSGRSNRDVHRLHSSSSSGQSDDERTSGSTKKRTQRKSRRPAFSTEEDDDERTDSADEGIEEAPPFKETNRPFFSLATSFTSGGASTFSPAILKPLSPTMLPVGYGSELLGTRVQSALPSVERDRTPTLDSPHPSESGQVSSDALSPEIAIAQEPSSVNSDQDRRIVTSAPLPPPSVPGTAGTTSILPSPSLPSTNTALPFAQWWGQPAMYSPFCGTSGSIASTPVATSEGHTYYPPGTGTILQAIICQEAEGLLIVNIRWRNKTYSGSLIDTTHHQWAPPRLAEGVPDAPIQLKFHASHDSEKEAVDVVIDEEEKEKENEDQVKDVAMEINEEGVVKSDLLKVDEAPENQYSDVTDTSDNENTDKTKSIDPSTIINKPPNGIQIPSILTPPTISGDDKPKPTPSLPSFDAVKSPQPQLGREETKSTNKSRDTTPPPPPTANHTVQFTGHNNLSNSVIVPNETKSLDHHHNLNTLVDVAASMKPVEDDEQSKQNNSKESHDVIKSTYNYHPPGGNESDSSGSGSLSPAKKKTHPFHQDKKGAETTDLSKTSRDDKQPDTPALTTMPFQFNLALQPISPGGDSEQQQQEKEHEPSSNKNQSKSNYWSPMTSSSELDGHYPPNKELDYRSTTDNPGVLVPSLIALESNNPNNNLQSVSHSVIQDKAKVPPRKRKLQSYNESNKRPSSPIKDQEMMPRINKPLPPLPSSLAPSNRVSSEPVVMSAQDMKTPPGFVYDPSLPMSLDYQLIAFERQKAAEEKQKDDRKSPKSKRIRSGEPDMMRHKTTPSPPNPYKRIVPPGIIPSDHMIHGRNMSIKQEPVARPGRPPSKGNHSSKQLQQTKKTSRSKNDIMSIKKEPPDTATQWPSSHQSFLPMPGLPPPLGLNLPPGVTMTSPTPGQPSATPLVHGVHVLHPPNWPPPPHVGAIQSSNNKSNKHDTQQHRGDLQIHPGGARRTPSPNPRKSHEWLGAPHPSGLPHVITSAPMKQEHLSGRPSNQSHPDSKPHLSSMGHLRMGTGRHHASNKHDSSRHSQSSSSHPPTQPSPTHPGLRSNGVGPTIVNPSSSEELIKMQLQLEALQKAGVSVPMPSTLPPQDLMMWQSRAAAQLAAMGQLPVDQALQMQLAMQQHLAAAAVAQQQQQQQQQQQNEAAAMANFQAIAAAQGMQAGIIPFMQPMPGFPTTPGGIGMVPFTLHPQPKRDS